MSGPADYSIIGNGPGGCASAVLLSAMGHAVTLYGRRPRRREAAAAVGGLTLLEADKTIVASDIHFTESIAEAITGVRNIVLAVPTSAIVDYATAMAAHLDPAARVLLAPGHTGGTLAFVRALGNVDSTLAARVAVAETFTLPFVARMTGPAEVTVWRRMAHLLIGARPVDSLPDFLEAFSTPFPTLEPVENVMVSSLSNINAVLHPPGMIGNIGWIERTRGNFRFYSEGVTPGIASLMGAIDRERLAVADAYGVPVAPFLDLFFRAGLTDEENYASGDIYAAVHNSGPNTLIKSPGELTDRYVAEDVGCGLVAIAALADAGGVATPIIDSFVRLATEINGVDYFREGLNADRLGIAGMSAKEVLGHACG
jgi:opine dehydrogenase